MQNGEVVIGEEIEFQLTDGTRRIISVSAAPVRDERGQIINGVVVDEDITLRKQAEQNLRESEISLRRLYESKIIGVVHYMLEGQITDANDKFLEIIGYTREDLQAGKVNWRQMTPSEYQSLDEYAIEELKTTGINTPYEKEYIRKDGLHISVIIGATAIDREKGIAFVLDITKRKQVEEALAESEKQFRTLVTASSEVLYRMSPDWSEMLQLQSRSFLANTEKPNRNWLQEYIHSEDQPHVWAVINEAIRTKSIFELEHRVRRADGSLGWTSSRAIPLLDANGEIVEWFGAASDITERKRAEEALKKAHESLEEKVKERTLELERAYNSLKESEGKLKALFNLLPVGVSITNKKRELLDVNLALERILGLTRSDLLKGKQANRKYIRADGTVMLVEDFPSVKALKNEGSIQSSEIGIIKEDDSTIWTDVSAIALPFSDGQVVITTRDITESKKAEEKQERLLDIIQQEKDRLATLINSITDEVWFADTQKNFALVNPSGIGEFDINSKKEIEIEKFVADQEIYRPDGSLRPVMEPPALRALQGEIIKNEEEIVRIPTRGELRYRHVSAAPVRDSNGNIIGSISVVRDITEQKN